MKLLSNKKLLWLSTGISLLGVFVASIATAAWFQIDSQPIKTSLVSSSPNISIDNEDIYGYKIKHNIGSNGYIDYSSSTVAKIQGSQIAGTNIHQDDEDINFDVPSGGIGYYLVKKNPGGSYKYTYSDTSYSWKFNEYAESNRSYIGNISFSINDSLIVKRYTFENNKTINKQVDVTTAYGAGSSVENNAVTIATAGTYKVWYDSNAKTIGFEDISVALANKNVPNSRLKTTTKKNAPASNQIVIYYKINNADWGDYSGFTCNMSLDNSNWYTASKTTGTETSTGYWKYTFTTTSTYTKMYCYLNSGSYYRHPTTGSQDWNRNNSQINTDITLKPGWAYVINYDGIHYRDDNWEHVWFYYDVSIVKNNPTNAKTYYLYDPNNDFGTGTHYAYLWDDYGGYSTVDFPGVAMTKVANHNFLYSIDSYSDYDKVIFSDGTNSKQSSNITLGTGTSVAYDYSSPGWYNPNATTATTYTYYLYDPDNYYEGNGYTHYWSEKYLLTGSGVVAMTSTGTDRLFSVTINAYYDRILFCKTSTYGTQTADLVIPQTNKYYVLTSGTTGSWKDLSAIAGTTRTIRLYDPNGYFGDAPKLYAYESSISHYPTKNADWPGIAMTQSDDRTDGHLWTATISTTYNKIRFANSSGTVYTSSSGLTPSGTKYFVATSKDGATVSGNWYTTLASEETATYYFYDNRISGRWTSPYAYVWASSGITGETENYSIYPCRAAAWPGVAMTQATEHAAEVGVESEYLWSITVSTSYDKIIFAKDSEASSSNYSHQTIDLTTTGNDGKMCVLTTQIPSGADKDKWTVQWANTIYGVTFKASFFIGSKHSTIPSEDLDTDNALELIPYTPTYSAPANITKAVAADGIVYYFGKANSTWYIDENCTTPYSASAPTSIFTLYAKYTVDVSGYKNIYIDTVNTDWGDDVYISNGDGTEIYFGAYKVAPSLYRVTLPNEWIIRATKNNSVTGDTNGNWWSNQITIDSLSNNSYGLLNTDGNNNRPFSIKSLVSTSFGEAVIKTYNGSTWETLATMELGDGTSNYFIYEHGLQIPVNTRVQVVITGGTVGAAGTYNYDKYLIPSGTTTPYVKDDSGYIKTTDYTGNARFNFYITANKELTIAMVPDLGNGYYIMDYNPSYGTNNYISETKMSSSSKTRAIYDGYYATAGKRVFIKSYLDAVDTLYTTLSASSSTYATISEGVITITSPGYYSIEVDNGTINISSYNVEDDFKLNKLDVSKNTSQELIWKQKTSIVLEVPFTCNNDYDSTLSLDADFGNLANFIGASLYVTDSALSDPYTSLRGNNSSTRSTYYNSLSNESTLEDLNEFVIPANSGETVYYAYILIDYLPTGTGVSYANFTNSTYLAGQIWFYLKDTQA